MSLLNLQKFPISGLIKGFRKTKSVNVPELRMSVHEFFHEKTNATHYHIERDDRNKVFGVMLRTPAPNSSGVPHILEHTVLCGSQKFPVRDPFFKMLTRSQATFMNAMTASDWTLYPFSTMNDKDYINLLHIYCDAVFNPQLNELNFLQEGWRLEPDEKNSDKFNVKGVVYNEMKGVFSDSMSNLAHQCENNLLPKTYPYISGGDPIVIPELSHQQLKDFHSKLYHPTNSRFFTYGNIDLEQVMGIIDSEYLARFTKLDVDTKIHTEPKWKEPKSMVIHCEPDPMLVDSTKGFSIVTSYAVADCTDTYTSFCMSVLSSLLMNGDNAPLYQALIESGLCQSWVDSLCGFDPSHRTSTFYLGLKGVSEDRLGDIETVTRQELEKVVRDGIPQERIDSLIHQVELSLKHEGANFGLHLIFKMSSEINHDAPLEDVCVFMEYIDRFRNDLKENPKFLQDILQKYLLKNPHKLTVTMKPKSDFNKQKAEEEKKLIEKLNSQLTPEKKIELTEKAKQLAEVQKAQENLDCLPCLQLEDIPEKTEYYPVELTDDKIIQLNKYNTNGILYFKAIFDLRGLDKELIPYVPLFCNVVTSMSTDQMSYREIDQAIESCCSGMNVNTQLVGAVHSLDQSHNRYGVECASYCLYRNIDRMIDLWSHLMTGSQFDNAGDADIDRLFTLIQMSTASEWSADNLVGSAHMYAIKRAAAAISGLSNISEVWNGLEQAKLMMGLASMSKDQLRTEIMPKLQKIKALIFNRKRMKVAINIEEDKAQTALPVIQKFLNSLPSADYDSSQILETGTRFSNNSHIVLPYTVNYAATVIQSDCYTHPDYAKSKILSRLLSSKYLLREVREIGGAYGVGAGMSPGEFSFFTYRDPQSLKSLQKFKDSLQWSIDANLDDQLLTESKLSVFQQLDKPLSVSSKGLDFFRSGLTNELRQQNRDQLFSVTVADMKDAANKLLHTKTQAHVVIGPESNEMNQSDERWEKVQFDMEME